MIYIIYLSNMNETLTNGTMKIGQKAVTNDFAKFTRTHTKSESYLYNNRLFFSNLISKEQYNLNHHWIEYL